jgi:hypothetical protein
MYAGADDEVDPYAFEINTSSLPSSKRGGGSSSSSSRRRGGGGPSSSSNSNSYSSKANTYSSNSSSSSSVKKDRNNNASAASNMSALDRANQYLNMYKKKPAAAEVTGGGTAEAIGGSKVNASGKPGRCTF